MVTAEELTVAIKSEGVGETRQDLEGVEGAMRDTAESAGDSAEQLQGFSEQFAGAMTAAVSALALGAAGLLSQVPVLGETFAGLGAIVDALAFQMDGVLRPALTPLTNAFFELSQMIFEADGIIGSIIGALATVVSIVVAAIPTIAAIGSALGVWASTGAGVISILGTIGGVLATVAGAIISLPGLLAAALVGIVAFVTAYLTNWRGTRDKTNKIIGQIVDFVVGGFKSLASAALDKVDTFVGKVVDFFTGLASDISEWAAGVASDAAQWGKDIIRALIDGMASLAGSVAEAFEGILNGLIRAINAAISQLPNEVTSRLGIEQFGRIDLDTDIGAGSGGAAGGTPGGRGRPIARTANGQGVALDGRKLSEDTGRYRADPGRRRGL